MLSHALYQERRRGAGCDILECANLALVVKLVVQGPLNTGIHVGCDCWIIADGDERSGSWGFARPSTLGQVEGLAPCDVLWRHCLPVRFRVAEVGGRQPEVGCYLVISGFVLEF